MGIFLRRLWIHRGNVVAVFKGLERPMQQSWTGEENEAFLKPGDNEAIGLSSSATLSLDDPMVGVGRTLEGDASQVHARLNVRETARLSLHFSMLWVSALNGVSIRRCKVLTRIQFAVSLGRRMSDIISDRPVRPITSSVYVLSTPLSLVPQS